jgi:hypothetical protein
MENFNMASTIYVTIPNNLGLDEVFSSKVREKSRALMTTLLMSGEFPKGKPIPQQEFLRLLVRQNSEQAVDFFNLRAGLVKNGFIEVTKVDSGPQDKTSGYSRLRKRALLMEEEIRQLKKRLAEG